MIQLANDRNIDQVLLEFKEYAAEVDVDFVRKVSSSILHLKNIVRLQGIWTEDRRFVATPSALLLTDCIQWQPRWSRSLRIFQCFRMLFGRMPVR